jgi:hypothetical protein
VLPVTTCHWGIRDALFQCAYAIESQLGSRIWHVTDVPFRNLQCFKLHLKLHLLLHFCPVCHMLPQGSVAPNVQRWPGPINLMSSAFLAAAWGSAGGAVSGGNASARGNPASASPALRLEGQSVISSRSHTCLAAYWSGDRNSPTCFCTHKPRLW